MAAYARWRWLLLLLGVCLVVAPIAAVSPASAHERVSLMEGWCSALERSGETELTYSKSPAGTVTVSGRRVINAPTGLPLAQQAGGTWVWLVADVQSNIRLAQDTESGVVQPTNYHPFGEPASPGLPGERGFLNKIHDPRRAGSVDATTAPWSSATGPTFGARVWLTT